MENTQTTIEAGKIKEILHNIIASYTVAMKDFSVAVYKTEEGEYDVSINFKV